MYEPYGYEDNSNYISKKDQIERELQQNRINDCKEFASVEYNETLQAFVFKNVKGQERGYAYMSDIIPSDLIKDAYYDSSTKSLIITFVNGKIVTIPLDDLIDVVEAGDGLKNIDGKFYINLTEDCERFLTVDENGLKLSGVQDAINVERDRAISAETEEYNRATQSERDLAAAIRQEATERTENDNLIRQTIGNDFSINPTETVSFKFNQLSEKVQKEIDDRGTAVSQEAQLRELGDSNLSGKITQEINNRTAEVSELRSTKANKSDVYTKDEVYTKEECDARYLSGGSGSTDAYTKEESDARFQPKGDYLTQDSLNGYATQEWVENKGYLTEHQPLDEYAKIEYVNAELSGKADASVVYTQEEVDAIVAEKEVEIVKANNEILTLKNIVGELGGNVEWDVPADGTFNNMMKKSGIVKLGEDTTTSTYTGGITSANKTKLHLNGKNLTFSGATTNNPCIMTRGKQELTIMGNGTFDAAGRIAVEANGADTVINLSGTTGFFAAEPTYVTDRSGGELIYCYLGTINITNGTFKNLGEDKKFLLNCYDANYKNGTAKIVVTGGKFYDFNPADNSAEGEHTSFLVEGYHVEVSQDGESTVYTVKKDS